MRYILEPNAKINLGLNVTGVLENGYHLLDMVMIPISLSDKIVVDIEERIGDLKINTNIKGIPIDKENILCRVYEAFYNASGIEKREISIYLEKNIPHEAGLGGGSSDGAFFLKFLNGYHGNIFTIEKLIEIGKKIGADIPFFIVNKSSRVRGIGEQIDIIENNLDSDIIILKPIFGVSTAVAYKNIDTLNDKVDANIEKIVRGLKENNLQLVEDSIENQLEQGLLVSDYNIIDFRKKLEEIVGERFFMSGSGSAYYTFVQPQRAKDKMEALKKHLHHCRVYLCRGL